LFHISRDVDENPLVVEVAFLVPRILAYKHALHRRFLPLFHRLPIEFPFD
jgi:hypothetical protein